jgi:hypothetical protein
MDYFISIFLGWPAIIASVGLVIAGLWRRNYKFLVIAAIMAVPFSWYLSGFPIVKSPIFLLPVLVLSSAYAQYTEHEMIAWLLAVPYFLAILLLFFMVSA